MNLDHESITLGCRLGLINNYYAAPCITVVILIFGEEGVGHSPLIRQLDDSHVGQVLAMATSFAYIIMNRKLQPHSQFRSADYMLAICHEKEKTAVT